MHNRRSFLSRLWFLIGGVALAECILGGLAFIVSGRKATGAKEAAQLIDAGVLSDFSPGTVTYIQGANCYLSRLEDGGFLAISRKCTHLGCAVPWIPERKQFECPCHASVFDMTGNVLRSPAPRSLDLYPLSLTKNRVMIDTSKTLRRSLFNKEQLTYLKEKG